MTEAALAGDTVEKADVREFWYRRIHSLTGFIPLSVFLVAHFLGNLKSTAAIKDSGLSFNLYAQELHGLAIFNFVEAAVLIPLFYHAFYGLYRVMARERWNIQKIQNSSNTRYVLQRVTGIFLIPFLVYHIGSLRFAQAFFGVHVDYKYVVEHLSHPVAGVLYLLGIASASYHWANGLWGFLITWGITSGRRAQELSWKICLVLGVLIFALGFDAFLGFYNKGISFNF